MWSEDVAGVGDWLARRAQAGEDVRPRGGADPRGGARGDRAPAPGRRVLDPGGRGGVRRDGAAARGGDGGPAGGEAPPGERRRPGPVAAGARVVQIRCPVCSARYSAEAGALDEDARRAVRLLGEFEGVPPGLLIEYLGLFRTPARGLPWRRAARLLDELAGVWRAGEVRRRGRAWALTPGCGARGSRRWWGGGREGRLDLPLRRHAYLSEVLGAHLRADAGGRGAPARGGAPGRPPRGRRPPPGRGGAAAGARAGPRADAGRGAGGGPAVAGPARPGAVLMPGGDWSRARHEAREQAAVRGLAVARVQRLAAGGMSVSRAEREVAEAMGASRGSVRRWRLAAEAEPAATAPAALVDRARGGRRPSVWDAPGAGEAWEIWLADYLRPRAPRLERLLAPDRPARGGAGVGDPAGDRVPPAAASRGPGRGAGAGARGPDRGRGDVSPPGPDGGGAAAARLRERRRRPAPGLRRARLGPGGAPGHLAVAGRADPADPRLADGGDRERGSGAPRPSGPRGPPRRAARGVRGQHPGRGGEVALGAEQPPVAERRRGGARGLRERRDRHPPLEAQAHRGGQGAGRGRVEAGRAGDQGPDRGRGQGPAARGAWTGPHPTAKPENYGSRAVPWETWLEIVRDGVAAYNARPGRRMEAAAGRSCDETWAAEVAEAPIRRLTVAQRAILLLAVESTVVAQDGTFRLAAGRGAGLPPNRYHSESLHAWRGRRVVARFDPQALHAGVHAFAPDGRWVCHAGCILPVGFNDAGAAREHNRARNEWARSLDRAERARDALRGPDGAARGPRAAGGGAGAGDAAEGRGDRAGGRAGGRGPRPTGRDRGAVRRRPAPAARRPPVAHGGRAMSAVTPIDAARGGGPDLRRELREHLDAEGVSIAEAASGIGMSAPAVSAWLRDAYRGDNDRMGRLAARWLATERAVAERRSGRLDRHADLAVTEQIGVLAMHAQATADLVLVYGTAGSGKTWALKRHCERHSEAWYVSMSPAVTTPASALARIRAGGGRGGRGDHRGAARARGDGPAPAPVRPARGRRGAPPVVGPARRGAVRLRRGRVRPRPRGQRAPVDPPRERGAGGPAREPGRGAAPAPGARPTRTRRPSRRPSSGARRRARAGGRCSRRRPGWVGCGR